MTSPTPPAPVEHQTKSVAKILKETFLTYRQGFWKLWLIYLVAFVAINAFVYVGRLILDIALNGSAVYLDSGYSWSYVYYNYLSTMDYRVVQQVVESNKFFLAGLFLTNFLADVLRNTLMSIPLALTILVTKKILYQTEEDLRSQLKTLLGIVGSVIAVGAIISLLVELGTYLFVVPGFLIAVFAGLVFPAMLEERLHPIASLKRSVELVRLKFFQVLGLITIIGLIQGVSWVVSYVLTNEVVLGKVSSLNSEQLVYFYLIANILSGVLSSVLAPLTGISAFILYKDLSFYQKAKMAGVGAIGGTGATYRTSQMQKAIVREAVEGQFCASCGTPHDGESQYCQKCGAVLTEQ